MDEINTQESALTDENKPELEPELEHGQLVLIGNVLHEVVKREYKTGGRFRGIVLPAGATVTFFTAYNPKRRAVKQLMREYGFTGGRQKRFINKMIRRSEKHQMRVQKRLMNEVLDEKVV